MFFDSGSVLAHILITPHTKSKADKTRSIMCSTSKVSDALKGLAAASSAASSGDVVPTVSAHRVREHRSNYLLVDVREEEEIEERPMSNCVVDAMINLGTIVHDASDLLELAAAAGGGSGPKTIVTVCRSGRRARIAAQSILEQSTKHRTRVACAVLQNGLIGWENAAAISPDFLVVLGVGGKELTEKLSLALAAVASAVDTYDNVVLVVMSDGVNWFVNREKETTSESTKKPPTTTTTCPNVEDVVQGEPYKPCKGMLSKFLLSGGVVFACTTCVKHRGYSFEKGDMMDCVQPLQMPDLIRMLGEVNKKGGSLQFT